MWLSCEFLHGGFIGSSSLNECILVSVLDSLVKLTLLMKYRF